MAQARGSAIVANLLLLCVLLVCMNGDATNFTVGDAKGWGLNVKDWPNGKSFKAGDVLCKYNSVLLLGKAACTNTLLLSFYFQFIHKPNKSFCKKKKK